MLWVGGILSQWLGSAQDNQGWLASLFLLLAGLLTLLGARTTDDARALVCVALVGFVAEVVGSRFGFPFGSYIYTGALKPQLWGVPIVMSLAWMTLVAHSLDLAAHLRLPAWGLSLIAALWTTAIDLVIDPLAANELGYWRWSQGGIYYGIPAINFAGWFLTSLLACRVAGPRLQPNIWASGVGMAILLFFAFIALANSLLPVALIGFGLFAAGIFVRIGFRPN